MTLVVARISNDRIAIVADTLVSEHDTALPLRSNVLKTCCLPGYLCAAYNNSPDLAAKAFHDFCRAFPSGANYEDTVKFFERSSSDSGNDYILAFGKHPKLVTIRNGNRLQTLSNTHWIGDQNGFELFRQHEAKARGRYEAGRAVNAALFADEMTGSPASDLYGIMRNVILDNSVPSVGGFATVISNRDIGFRYSVYSDMLYDWPISLPETGHLQLTDKFTLNASDQNERYSINQISPGYYNANIVAFYVMKGRLLIVFLGCADGLPGRCLTIPDVEAQAVPQTLNHVLAIDMRPICMIMSPVSDGFERSNDIPDNYGIGFRMRCEVNTMTDAQA